MRHEHRKRSDASLVFFSHLNSWNKTNADHNDETYDEPENAAAVETKAAATVNFMLLS